MPLPTVYPLRRALIFSNNMCINFLSGSTDKELCHHDTIYFNTIESTDPYYTINEQDMMSNFPKNSGIPSSSSEFWSDITKVPTERPFSPNLLESCCQEMEKKIMNIYGFCVHRQLLQCARIL